MFREEEGVKKKDGHKIKLLEVFYVGAEEEQSEQTINT
jgi:hypothetical protein